MTTFSPEQLLDQLRRAGATVRAKGDRLRVEAPEGAPTQQVRQTLATLELQLLDRLREETPAIVQMPLFQFAQEGYPLHMEVPGLWESMWFVPVEADLRRLEAEGVRRARIWTVIELRELVSQPGLTSDDAITIARVRLVFDATVVGFGPIDWDGLAPGNSDAVTDDTCFPYRGSRLWCSTLAAQLICGTCHPQADEPFVAQRILAKPSGVGGE